MEASSRLIGKWVSVDSGGQKTTIEFTLDGGLEFTFHGEEKDQKMFLTYIVQGTSLVINQPSHPREERTEFEFTDEGDLVLTYDEVKTVYERL